MQHEDYNGKIFESENGTFWTLCPYCYYLYQYDLVYVECSLRCQNCRKSFHGVAVAPPPPGMLVEGKDQYYLGIACFSLKYGLGTSLNDKKGENLGVRASPLAEKNVHNEGFESNSENFVLISDDDSDSDHEIGEKEECKNENNCNVKKNEDETGPVLQGSLGTEGKDVDMKTKRKRNVKAVVRNTKKLMGRGIRYTGPELGGKTYADAELKEQVGDSQPENTGKIGSEEEEGFPENDLEFFIGDDDIFVGLKSII